MSAETETRKLLTPEDLAEHFGAASGRVVLDWSRKFNWPRTQVGRAVRWTPEQLAQIERLHAVTPTGVLPRDGRTSRSARRSA